MNDPLAAALSSLAPVPAALNRERLMYEAGLTAGRRAGRRNGRTVAIIAVAVAVLMAVRPTEKKPEIVFTKHDMLPTVREPAVVVAPEPETANTAEVARWLELRNAVLADGVDALPPAPPGTADPAGTSPLRGRTPNFD